MGLHLYQHQILNNPTFAPICFCSLSGRSGLFMTVELLPIALEPRLHGGTVIRPPRTAVRFAYRGADFYNVRVSFRPRIFF